MRYLIIAVVLLSVLSCTKVGRNITVKGKVVNPVTNAPFEGIEVWFQRTTNQLPGGYKTIKEEITDANGEFEINATRIGGTQYIRLGDVKGNYRLGWYEDGEYKGTSVKKVTKGKTMEVEYHLVPYGEVIFDIENINCQGATDTMWLQHRSQFEDSYPEWWAIPRSGCYAYTSPQPTNELYIGKRFFRLRIMRGGVETFEEYEYQILKDEVTTVTLHY